MTILRIIYISICILCFLTEVYKLTLWFLKPNMPIASHERNSSKPFGVNKFMFWNKLLNLFPAPQKEAIYTWLNLIVPFGGSFLGLKRCLTVNLVPFDAAKQIPVPSLNFAIGHLILSWLLKLEHCLAIGNNWLLAIMNR